MNQMALLGPSQIWALSWLVGRHWALGDAWLPSWARTGHGGALVCPSTKRSNIVLIPANTPWLTWVSLRPPACPPAGLLVTASTGAVLIGWSWPAPMRSWLDADPCARTVSEQEQPPSSAPKWTFWSFVDAHLPAVAITCTGWPETRMNHPYRSLSVCVWRQVGYPLALMCIWTRYFLWSLRSWVHAKRAYGKSNVNRNSLAPVVPKAFYWYTYKWQHFSLFHCQCSSHFHSNIVINK